jgi:alpha-mannosidase
VGIGTGRIAAAEFCRRTLMSSRLPFGLLLLAAACPAISGGRAQTAYFADGYHGGIYGHYPPTFTQFMVDALRANPDWKLNLEIEPETWDFAQTNTPEAYQAFKKFADDQSTNRRLEFVNPDYAQSYLWNLNGESVLQQFDRGMRKIHEHFPGVVFSTYSSEEPCFASALPGILKSFGFKYAVLKNPNTCWGGYTGAFGGELVNWIGPDGSAIPAVPRYAIEQLRPGSTWETIANANSPDFVNSAFAAHIEHPIGMCYQDAGWRYGPWLNHVGNYYQPTKSILWQDYFQNVANPSNAKDWRLSQEDVQVSLVWGAQVLQRIAQEVRTAENRIVMAEKMAVIAGVFQNSPWPGGTLDEAWRTLLLSQHHDCWIVPYNHHGQGTWADEVAQWTGGTCSRSDAVLAASLTALAPAETNGDHYFVRVFNTLAERRTESVTLTLPADWHRNALELTDHQGKEMPYQWLGPDDASPQKIVFRPTVPPLGFATYRLNEGHDASPAAPASNPQTSGLVTLNTDYYELQLDAVHGGTIKRLIAKKLGGRDLVDSADARSFNEIRGYFFEQRQFCSTADGPAKIEIVENGPRQTRVRISSRVASNPVIQTITLTQGEPRIDFSVRIDWQGSPGIGANFRQDEVYDAKQERRAFYDERSKLLVSFPLNLQHQEVFKDAPFDVVESHLSNTFFTNWSVIKNDVILDWVDVFDKSEDAGAALLTDHTTSYGHGANDPLSLTLQYSGVGLWGRHYSLNGATEVHYAILPHAGNWEESGLWTANKSWNEPLIARVFQSNAESVGTDKSLLEIAGGGWEIPAARLSGGDVFVRLFNPSTRESRKAIHYGGPASQVDLTQLDGRLLKNIPFRKNSDGTSGFDVTLPAFGIGTLRITP